MSTLNQQIYNRAAEARKFLHIHGFTSEIVNEKIWKRIDKYGDQHKVNKFIKGVKKNPDHKAGTV